MIPSILPYTPSFQTRLMPLLYHTDIWNWSQLARDGRSLCSVPKSILVALKPEG